MVKFLVIRFSSIGDIVLTTPVVRCLKQQVEEAQVHYLTKKEYAHLLNANPYIDKIHVLDNNMQALIKELKNEFFDHIIDLHKNIRSFRVKKQLGLPAFSVDKINWEKWLLVNLNINKLPDKHIVERYFETVTVFDVKNDKKGLDHFIPFHDEVNLLSLPGDFPYGYIAFVIGAKHNTKKLPREKIIDICTKTDHNIILLGGKVDAETGEHIQQAAGKTVFNACGKYNINQSASLIRQSKLVITHDTGLMHIAAAYKKKIISVWGNTIPEFGMYPYMPDNKSIIAQVKNLKCRPCSKIGFRRCPKGHFRCMQEMDTDRIAQLAMFLTMEAFDKIPQKD